MDIYFVTISFILFLIISYLLGIIRLSYPLVLIYIVFCFSYIIKQDSEKEIMPSVKILNDTSNYDSTYNIQKSVIEGNSITGISNNKNLEKVVEKKVSKPIVSFNPKPIIIDSNLLIQKDAEKTKIKKANSQKDEPAKINANNDKLFSTLKLKEIMICRGVYKRNPIKPGFSFTNNVDSLFCYTKISNSGPKQEIKHVWYYQDKLISSVAYNIKTSYNYRSWSQKTILPKQIGKWRVDIIDSKNFILGSRNFEISSFNDIY